jgi:hypothetical protein
VCKLGTLSAASDRWILTSMMLLLSLLYQGIMDSLYNLAVLSVSYRLVSYTC